MKHRNKALLSSLAMLIVTAITLSSATFAWFTAGTVVTVDTIKASIENQDGSLLISADNSNYGVRAKAIDMLNYSGNTIPLDGNGDKSLVDGRFIPISVTPSTGTKIAGSMNNTRLFKATSAATTGFIEVNLWLKAETDMTVKIDPTFTATPVSFIYAQVTVDGGSSVVLASSSAGDSYFPIANTSVECVDSSGNGIIDPSDDDYLPAMLGNEVTSSGTSTINVSLTGGTPKKFTVLIWAEGQDSNCSGPVALTTATMDITVTKL